MFEKKYLYTANDHNDIPYFYTKYIETTQIRYWFDIRFGYTANN